MSELNCSTIPCLGSMEKGEFILLAIEVVGYFDRSAGIQRSLQMGTFQRVLRRVFTKKIINIFNIFVINITIIDIMIIVIVTIVMIEWSVSPLRCPRMSENRSLVPKRVIIMTVTQAACTFCHMTIRREIEASTPMTHKISMLWTKPHDSTHDSETLINSCTSRRRV